MKIEEKYITDSQGNRLGVLLGIEEYQHLLEQLEELNALKAYDRVKQLRDEVIPFEQAINEIEKER